MEMSAQPAPLLHTTMILGHEVDDVQSQRPAVTRWPLRVDAARDRDARKTLASFRSVDQIRAGNASGSPPLRNWSEATRIALPGAEKPQPPGRSFLKTQHAWDHSNKTRCLPLNGVRLFGITACYHGSLPLLAEHQHHRADDRRAHPRLVVRRRRK
jgi:hypothetical protein